MYNMARSRTSWRLRRVQIPPANLQLWDAAKAGDWASIEEALLLASSSSNDTTITTTSNSSNIINTHDPRSHDRTALLLAIHYRKWEVVDQLLDQEEIDIEASDYDGATPIVCASQNGNLALLQRLETMGANLQHRTFNGSLGVLEHAINGGHSDIVRYLFDKNCNTGWNLNLATGKCAQTCLHRACHAINYHNNHDLIALLLQKGADIHATCSHYLNRDNMTALHIAASKCNVRLIRVLLEHGARLEDTNDRGETPLYLSIGAGIFGDVQAVQQLAIQQRANIFHRNNQDQTPLDVAINFPTGNMNGICDTLLTAYRDHKLSLVTPTAREDDDDDEKERGRRLVVHQLFRTADFVNFTENSDSFHVPLHPFRVRFPDLGTLTTGCLQTLLELFIPDRMQVKDSEGMLPFHIAVAGGASVEVLEMLGFPYACRFADHSGALAVHHACKASASLEVIRYLLETGGVETIRKRDNEGRLPLHLLFQEQKSNPATLLGKVQYLVEAYPRSVSTRAANGDLPITLAGASASLDVINFLLQQNLADGNSVIN